MRLRQLFREQEQTPEVADVIVFWMEGDEEVRYMFENVPVEEIRKPNFRQVLENIVSKNFSRVLFRYQVVGDVTSQGNPDGNTPDTEVPPVLTSKDNEEVPPVEQRPDEIEAPTADEIEDAINDAAEDANVQNIEVEIIPDSDGEPEQVEITPQDETEPPPSINGVEIISPAELDRMLDDYADSVDQDGDGLNDETGERVTRSSDLPPVSVPKIGGGLDGDTGDEGTEGEEGAVTGEQRAEIPSIIEELRASMSGPGTSEVRMIDALRRIESEAHLEAVVEMYREEYGDSLPQDIIDEFKYDLGGDNEYQIGEINRVMRTLGWEITGTRYLDMRWQKYEGSEETSSDNEEGNDSGMDADNPSDFTPTDEEREQMAEANYIYEQILNDARENNNWSQIEPIEYTNENGDVAFIRNPAERFGLPDKPFSGNDLTAQDLEDIKIRIAELFPLISGARMDNPEPQEGRPMQITVDQGYFAYTRQLEGEE